MLANIVFDGRAEFQQKTAEDMLLAADRLAPSYGVLDMLALYLTGWHCMCQAGTVLDRRAECHVAEDKSLAADRLALFNRHVECRQKTRCWPLTGWHKAMASSSDRWASPAFGGPSSAPGLMNCSLLTPWIVAAAEFTLS